MTNYEDAKNRHLENISKSTGSNVSNRYSYILSQDELMGSYWNQRHDLNYALRKEVKRDRYVMNSQGLQKEINEICEDAISKAASDMVDLIADDTIDELIYQLNGIMQLSDGSIVRCGGSSGGKRNNNRDKTSRFISALTKRLVKSVSDLVDDMADPKQNKK